MPHHKTHSRLVAIRVKKNILVPRQKLDCKQKILKVCEDIVDCCEQDDLTGHGGKDNFVVDTSIVLLLEVK